MPVKTHEVEGVKYAMLDGNGNPVYTLQDGSEVGYDAESMATKINELNHENTDRRHKENRANDQLKAFEGLDPAAARKALDTVANLDNGTLLSAEKVEERIQAATQAVGAERDEWKTKATNMETAFARKMIDGEFGLSKYVQEKLIIPADLAAAKFATHFSVEDLDTNPRIVARDITGNQIFSKANPGNPATFDEALEMLVGAYPHRDNILKGVGKSGGGAPGGGGGGQNGAREVSFEESRRMATEDPAGFARQLAEGHIAIGAPPPRLANP